MLDLLAASSAIFSENLHFIPDGINTEYPGSTLIPLSVTTLFGFLAIISSLNSSENDGIKKSIPASPTFLQGFFTSLTFKNSIIYFYPKSFIIELIVKHNSSISTLSILLLQVTNQYSLLP